MKTAPLLAAVVLLAPAPVLAARYDPSFDRAALRQAATSAHSGIVEATGLALELEKVPAITAGLDEGLRQARLAADAARALDAAARQRGAALETGSKDAALARRIKEVSEPVAAERLRLSRLASAQSELTAKVDDLPDEARKKLRPLLAKAGAGLRSAGDALRPLEEAVKVMGERALAMKELQRDSRGPLVEISSAAAGTVLRAEELPPALAEAKARLASLGEEPRAAARSRAWEKLDRLRDIARLLFQEADRACNRADELRRVSSDHDRAADGFERALGTAAAGPASAAFLDEAQKLHQEVRDRLKEPPAGR
ncbi:MAG: hypothetical protein HYV14_16230 [Elusimicrobia bacterium]|nr:hypothetical protein [Elusimicrobiota bacterium]